MRGLNVKRGVESTLERVFNNTGRKFDTLRVSWTGSTAGVSTKRVSGLIDAHVVFPGVDETSEVPSSVFNDLIGCFLIRVILHHQTLILCWGFNRATL